jgi:hypothetical protein
MSTETRIKNRTYSLRRTDILGQVEIINSKGEFAGWIQTVSGQSVLIGAPSNWNTKDRRIAIAAADQLLTLI